MAEFMSERFGSAIIDNFGTDVLVFMLMHPKRCLFEQLSNLWKMATQGSILRQLIGRLNKTETAASYVDEAGIHLAVSESDFLHEKACLFNQYPCHTYPIQR